MCIKKGKANYIAPLQPLTVASVKTWRSSEGAGRVGLSRLQRYKLFLDSPKVCLILCKNEIFG